VNFHFMSDNKSVDQRAYFEAQENFNAGRYALCIDDFLRLSLAGDSRASLYAATILDRGGNGITRDQGRARTLYQTSLKQSYLPGAALALGLMFYRGQGGDKDYVQARKCFEMLRGNAFASIMLGIMSEKGLGCSKNEEEALNKFDNAWKLGHPIGLKNSAILRIHRGECLRGIIDFMRSSIGIFWTYGVRRYPLVKSPKDAAKKSL
jgi:TPR repeat protein